MIVERTNEDWADNIQFYIKYAFYATTDFFLRLLFLKYRLKFLNIGIFDDIIDAFKSEKLFKFFHIKFFIH